jgi:hypothetical protein
MSIRLLFGFFSQLGFVQSADMPHIVRAVTCGWTPGIASCCGKMFPCSNIVPFDGVVQTDIEMSVKQPLFFF